MQEWVALQAQGLVLCRQILSCSASSTATPALEPRCTHATRTPSWAASRSGATTTSAGLTMYGSSPAGFPDDVWPVLLPVIQMQLLPCSAAGAQAWYLESKLAVLLLHGLDHRPAQLLIHC